MMNPTMDSYQKIAIMSNDYLVEAAGCIVCRYNAKDKLQVLLVHGKTNDPDYYGFPKGHREPGEPVETTATRETEEETGLQVEVLALVGLSQYMVLKHGVERPKVVRYYLARVIGGDMSKADDEHDSIEWKKITKASKLLTYRADKQTLKVARKYVANSDLYRSLIYDQQALRT